MVHPGSPLDPGAGWDRPTAGVGPRCLWPVGQGNDTPPNEGVRKWRYPPQKIHFRLGFSIITFWVPPCMETPKWSKVLKYVEDVFAGISPLKFNGKITFLVSTSNFQGSALSFIPFSVTETSVMQSMRRKILADYLVNVILFFPPCTLHIGLSKLGTPKS